MIRRGDDRAVTVQIGAILLLAILFSALAIYQVNGVPAENQVIENEHNRQVQGEMSELRNAIKNVGAPGEPERASASVTLGTSYPTRTFLTNPPDPSGTLETTDAGTVRVDNATVDGAYSGDADALVGTSYETRTVVYEPSYNEYRNAPRTRIEHGYMFNEFDDAVIDRTKQPLIDGDQITIVLVEGNLSTSARETTTVDAKLLDGPTDPVDIEPDGGNITVTVPTASPAAWNETIGTTFDDGQNRSRVTAYADGSLMIELANDSDADYRLRMARVGVGDASSDGTDEFDISDARFDETESSGAYDVQWNRTRTDNDDDRVSCSADGCTVTVADKYDRVPTVVETVPSIDGATIEYAVSDDGTAAFPSGPGTIQDGEHTAELEARSNGTITAYASSGGTGDRLDVTVRIESGGSGLPEGRVAYHDENGNGAYDDGEPTYSESDLESLDVAGSLIVAKDAFSATGMDVSARTLTVEDGVQLSAESSGIQLTTTSGELRVGGTLNTTAGSGESVTLDAAGRTTLSDGTVRSGGDISVSSVGVIVADEAAFDGTAASDGSISIFGDDAVSMRRATVTTQGEITTAAGTSLDASAAGFESTGDGRTVALESSGDMTLDRTAIDVGTGGTMSGDLNQGSNTLYVDGAEFRQNGDPGTFDYSPNGVDVNGEPAVGSTN
ncbi:hypothetical protein SAMN05444422_10987 [Halobiforma haloterrestris]|uniref:Uncharacterized protein n=1 Tax=Natronobacterium haloterrestre TaxID=148448 RepID=A0A1I1JNX0_NATHA|nr:hypothetical protein [Halobiforma haloterrestris]SFC49652.1 hypothetical protein SAMN05444422_10987 [Halobiforma haloterrestris]